MTREERKHLSGTYKRLFNEVSAILFHHDPMDINFEDNKDEYDPEAGTILTRLRPEVSHDELTGIVYEELVRWFGLAVVGGRESCTAIAGEILSAYRNRESC